MEKMNIMIWTIVLILVLCAIFPNIQHASANVMCTKEPPFDAPAITNKMGWADVDAYPSTGKVEISSECGAVIWGGSASGFVGAKYTPTYTGNAIIFVDGYVNGVMKADLNVWASAEVAITILDINQNYVGSDVAICSWDCPECLTEYVTETFTGNAMFSLQKDTTYYVGVTCSAGVNNEESSDGGGFVDFAGDEFFRLDKITIKTSYAEITIDNFGGPVEGKDTYDVVEQIASSQIAGLTGWYSFHINAKNYHTGSVLFQPDGSELTRDFSGCDSRYVQFYTHHVVISLPTDQTSLDWTLSFEVDYEYSAEAQYGQTLGTISAGDAINGGLIGPVPYYYTGAESFSWGTWRSIAQGYVTGGEWQMFGVNGQVSDSYGNPSVGGAGMCVYVSFNQIEGFQKIITSGGFAELMISRDLRDLIALLGIDSLSDLPLEVVQVGYYLYIQQHVNETIDLVSKYIQNMPPEMFKNKPDQKKNALANKLSALKKTIASNDTEEAKDKIKNDIRAKMDGFVDGESNDDWIIDASQQKILCRMFDDLVLVIGTPNFEAALYDYLINASEL